MSATVHPFPARAETRPAATHSLCAATVTGAAGESFLLDHPHIAQARPAASCLLEPAPGDTVLLTHADDGSPCFILAVLQRPQADAGQLRLPGGNQLVSDTSGVRLHAEALSLNTASQLELNSAALKVNTVSADVNAKHWLGCFDTAETHAVNVRLTAKTFSSQVGRLIQRLMESFRKIDGLDETRAGRVRVSAQGHHHVDAGHLTHTAKGFVKIDGQKIDLG